MYLKFIFLMFINLIIILDTIIYKLVLLINMSRKYLSKSTFITGLQCPKALYFKKYKPELADEINLAKQNVFDVGNEVGLLAQKLFPGGIDASPEHYTKLAESISYTSDLINDGVDVIYEAGFEYDYVRCFIDILVKKNGKWHIYEVKSSTKVSETYINDASLQYYILKNCGLDVESVSIVHINNSYIKNRELDVFNFFSITPVLEKIQNKIDFVPIKLKELHEVLLENETPEIDIGKQCTKPYECDFKSYCWKDVPDYSVLNISRLKPDTKWGLYNSGYINIKDVPLDTKMSSNQRIQVDCEINQTNLFNKKKIKEFLDGLTNDVFHLDFETVGVAIPIFDGLKPYQPNPFQYSLHHEKNGKIIKHYEFLASSEEDSRELFIKSLIKDLQCSGDILVYNIGFERGRLKELIRSFPKYESDIQEIIDRMKDLMIPFKEKWYYVPEMQGSYSIKKVLPALVPDLTYKDLSINKGDVASLEFSNLNKKSLQEQENIRKDLLEYCKMDTFAMFKILEVLRKKI